jgi:hypothetical protein
MLERRIGRVVKHAGNPILARDNPWEGKMGMSPSVLFDERLGKYRMWYQCFSASDYFSRKGPSYFVGYAESDDAFTWTKPKIEGFPFGGWARTKIVTTGRGGRRAGAMQVLLNPDPSDPARRFMMVTIGAGSVDLAYSPDGLRWSIVEDEEGHSLCLPDRGLNRSDAHVRTRSVLRARGCAHRRCSPRRIWSSR